MSKAHLFPMIRDEFQKLNNRYLRHANVFEDIDKFIQPPQLAPYSGVLGALVLAEQASELSPAYTPEALIPDALSTERA